MTKKCRYAAAVLTQACTFVIKNIVNNCVEADNSKKIVESRALVTKAADAITIMGKLNLVTRVSPSQCIF